LVQGTVQGAAGYDFDCATDVFVKIQRRKSTGWKTLLKARTNSMGEYITHLPDKPGSYRAALPRVLHDDATGETCLPARSEVRRHRH
jgi:hypothetical protein